MPSITIRDVPPEVRDKLAERAELEGRSMQQYLLKELARLVERPSNREIFARARQRAREAGLSVSTEDILDALDADRR